MLFIDKALRISIDEATRNVSGSPHIPSTILNKINCSDIFIADVTTINSSDDKYRKVANPNVLIELGYAIPVLGWERIILVFNKQFGNFPDDLPFDIDRQRILDYKIKDYSDKSGKGQLVKELTDAILLIITNNPNKPNENKAISVFDKKRQNDVNTINEFSKSIHLPTLDVFIEELPDYIPNTIFFFWEEFNAKLESSYFFIYDEELKKLIYDFKNLWSASLSFGHRYNYSDRTERHIFYAPMDIMNQEQKKDYERLKKIRKKLYISYKSMLDLIRMKWPEIDITKNSDYAIS